MASRFRSPAEQEVQDYLDQVAAGQAGQSPKDQTLARSRDPRLQRIGQRNMADRTADNLANIEDAARQQEQARKEQEKQALKSAKEAEQAVEAQRAQSVRQGAALGQKTTTDIETGQRAIATHPDGSPVYKVGAVNKPFLAEQPDAANSNTLMLGQADGALGATGGTTTAVPAQTFRNDRGDTKTVALETKTDPKTGAITYTGKDSFGAPMQTQIGVDPEIAQKQQRLGRLEQEKAQTDLRRIQLGQARTMFEPRWQPTKAEYQAAKSKFESLANNYVREPNPKPGQPARWGVLGANGMWQPIPAPERNDKFQAWQKDMADSRTRLDRAAKAYEPAAKYHENLSQQERAARLQWLENRAEKIRIENNLPDDDGGISMHLAQQEDPSIGNPYEDAVSEVLGATQNSLENQGLQPTDGQKTDKTAPPQSDIGIPTSEPTGQGVPAPQTPAVQDAFKSLQGLQGVTVEPFKNFTALNRNGKWIGSLQTNDIGESIVTLKDDAMYQEDIARIVKDTDRGIPIYLRDNPNRPKASEEAAKVAMAFRTLNDPALAGDGQRIARTLQQQGLDPVSIRRAVDNGEMSVQSGKVLASKIWGDTLEAPKFDDAANFQAWLDRKTKDADAALQGRYGNPALQDQNAPGRVYQKAISKEGIPGITSAFNLDQQKAVKMDYARDWALENAGKPGVTRSDIKANYEKAIANNSGKVTSGANALRDLLVNDVIGSMVGLGAGVVGDLSSAEMAMLGNADAKKVLDESLKTRNQDWKAWKNAAGRNIKAWATPEGRATAATLNTSLDRLQKAIDEEAGSSAPDKARIDAAEIAVRDAALAMHNLNPDAAWPVTADNLDPNKDSALGSALADYQATADPRAFALYRERLLMNNTRRQLSEEMQRATKAQGTGFFGSVAGAMRAGWQEIGSEMIADAAALVTAGGSKAIQAGLKATGAIGKAARVESAANRISRGLEAVWNAGIKRGTLQAPLTVLDKARNVGVRAVQGAVGEGIEELAVSPGSDSPTLLQDFAVGMLGAVTLAPAQMVAESIRPGAGTSPTPITPQIARANETFATRYNAENAKTAGFEPVTPEQVQTARGFINTGEREQAINAIAQAVNDHGQIQGEDEASAGQRAQLRQQVAQTTAQLVTRQDDAIQAAQAVAAVPDAAKRTFYTGIAKVAAGNADQLTANEMKAIQGARTEAGADYFEQVPQADGTFRERLTTEAVDELRTTMPAVARLAGASTPTPTAQSNVTIPQAQVAPAQAQAQPPAALPQESGATGVGTEVPGSGGAAASGAGEPGLVTQPTDAPAQSEAPATAPAANVDALPQTPPAQTGDAKSSGMGETVPAETDPFEPTADDAASLERRMQAEAVAEEVVSRVEKSIPGIKGRIQIAEERAIMQSGKAMESGGAYADPNGRIVLPLPDIEAELDRNGGDANALADVLERYVSAHEVVHLIQYSSVESAWKEAGSKGTLNQFFNDWYGKMHAELGDGVMSAAARIYGQDAWNQITPAAKAAEVVRMLVESRINPDAADVSELFREVRQAKSPTLIETIKRAIELLKDLLTKGELPQDVQDHVDQIEALYRELTQQSPAQAAEPTGIATEGTASAEGNGGGDSGNEAAGWQVRNENLGESYKAAKRQVDEIESRIEAQRRKDSITLPPGFNTYPDATSEGMVVLEDSEGNDIRYPVTMEEAAREAWGIHGGEQFAETQKLEKRLSKPLQQARDAMAKAGQAWDNNGPNPKAAEIQAEADAKKAAEEKQRQATAKAKKTREANKQAEQTPTSITLEDFSAKQSADVDFIMEFMPRQRDQLAFIEALAKTKRIKQRPLDEMLEAHAKEWMGDSTSGHRQLYDALVRAGLVETPPVTKRTRQIDSPARREAFRLLNATDTQLTAINQILGNVGNIQAPPIGMLRLIKSQSKARNLTEKQMAMLRRWRDFSAYMPKASFGTTASGKVAQELHGMLFTTGESNAKLDDWAKALEENNNGPVTNDEALIAVMSELDRVAKGLSTGNPMDIENPTPEDIARAEAEQRAGMDQAEIEQQQAENFDAANTADNGGKPISMEDFTLDMVGKTVTVDGEVMRVVDVEWNGFLEQAESVTLEDGIRFGRQVLEDGEVVYVETSDASPAETPSPASTSARSTEKPAKASAPDAGKPSAFTVAPFSKEFGATSQIAKKADTAAKVIDRMKPEHRKDFVAAMDAEADRLRNGIISAEAWQRQNPEALSARAAVFQRFIDSHTPESFSDGLEKLLSPEVVARLGSSPSSTASDTEYLAAVERGDMETAQRMVDEAARAAGYNVGPVYHRTKADFTSFSRGYVRGQIGFHVGTKEHADNIFGGVKKGSKRLKLVVKAENPLRLKDPGGWYGWDFAQYINSVAGTSVRQTSSDEDVVRQLEAKGYDSIVYANMFEGDGETDSYVLFRPSQLKSGTPVTYDAQGNVIPLSQRFDPTKDSILYSSPSQTTDQAFYSQLQRTIEAKMPKTATPAQVVQIAASGAKAEEVKWSGLIPWLQGREKVSKDEVLEYLRNEGSVRFEEVTLGQSGETARQIVDQIESSGEFEVVSKFGEWAVERDGRPISRIPANIRALLDRLNTEFEGESEGDWDQAKKIGDPKFGQYTLPGGSNYREVVLAMPASAKGAAGMTVDEIAKALGYEGWTSYLTPEQQRQVNEAFAAQSYGPGKGPRIKPTGGSYKSSHFPDVPNYVAHMRTNERTDVDGKPGLFVEEFQSDRHQAGRKKGYREIVFPEQADQELKAKREEIANHLMVIIGEEPDAAKTASGYSDQLRDGELGGMGLKQYPNLMKEYLRIVGTPSTAREKWVVSAVDKTKDLAEQASNLAKGIREDRFKIADAPFRTTWPLALFKRALRDAVAGGKDWIGWTVGETQNDRFDLSKQVQQIDVTAPKGADLVPPGVSQFHEVTLRMQDRNDIDLQVRDGVVSGEQFEGRQLEDVVGKDVAQRILAVAPGSRATLAGDDLKVGGSGMKGFYDNMLPKEIGKYVKQWGGTIQKSSLGGETKPYDIRQVPAGWAVSGSEGTNAFSTEREAKEFATEKYGSPTPIWRIDITPEMRKGVSQGQALFSSPSPSDDLFADIMGPQAKAKQNAAKALESAKTDTAKENIAKMIARMEGVQADKFVGAVQKSFDFGMSGSIGSKNQPGLDFGSRKKETAEEEADRLAQLDVEADARSSAMMERDRRVVNGLPPMTQSEAAKTITKDQAKTILSESSLKDRPIRTYEQAVAANQVFMGTRIPEWSAFPFTGQMEDGKPMQDTTGIQSMEHAATMFPTGQSVGNCEWCGKQPVKNFYHIKHGGKNWTMLVGSECISHFADVSGEVMAAEARENLAKTTIAAIEDAKKELVREFRETVHVRYDKYESVWRSREAEAMVGKLDEIQGKTKADSGRAALSRWINNNLEAAQNELANFAELMAKPETIKRKIEWREKRIRKIETDLNHPLVSKRPQWEVDQWKRAAKQFKEEIAAIKGETIPTGATPSPLESKEEKPISEIDQRIADAETAGVVLSDADKKEIRSADEKAKELRAKGNRVSGMASDPLNKGNAFPMGVGFTRETKRSNQRIDASVRRAGEAVELYKRATAAENYRDALLQGKGTQADQQKKTDKREAFHRDLVKKLLTWKKGDAFREYTIDRINLDRDGYPASFNATGGGLIKGVNDKFEVVKEFFDRDVAKFRRMVDEARLEMSKAETPATPEQNKSLTQMVNEAIGATAPETESEKLRREADRITKEAMKLLDRIPPGQPIQSTRDRNLRERSAAMQKKASELLRKADEMDAATERTPGGNQITKSGPSWNITANGKTVSIHRYGNGYSATTAGSASSSPGIKWESALGWADNWLSQFAKTPAPAETPKQKLERLRKERRDITDRHIWDNMQSRGARPAPPDTAALDAEIAKAEEEAGQAIWQKTQAQVKSSLNMPPAKHRQYVEKALADGKKVPANVLAEYPDLSKKSGFSLESTTPGRIEDFGEKIAGARKDLWGKFKDSLTQELPEDGADITVSKYFPEPDYETAINSGVSADNLATYKAIRDIIPAKPRRSYKLSRWVEMVRGIRPTMQKLMNGIDEGLSQAELDKLQTALRGTQIGERVNFYKDLGYPAFTKAADWKILTGVSKLMKNGVRLEKPIRVTSALYKDRFVSNFETETAGLQGYIEVLNMIRERITQELQAPAEKKAKPIDFNIYKDRITGDIFIGKKALNGVVRLKTGFEDPKSARQYLTDNQAALEDQWNGLKKPVDYRKQVNAPRQGPDRREGDVTPAMFQDAFGFRGVQFGNWVEGERRQVDINEAFDAFMDLADALGIPPKAVSLDGSLGLAFGARGIPNAKAHYEPGQVVINLTKKAGPGSLGHEWFHAFDNYFARLDRTGETSPKPLDKFASQFSPAPKNMRPEVWEAFKGIRLALDSGPFAERSKKLDEVKSKPYYSTIIEKAARAFERYTVDRLKDKEVSNDFLVNISKDQSPALPTPEEMENGIRQAFDNLFNVLDSEPTEKGIKLFASRSRDTGTGDLFAAAQAPDAKAKLGDVKVGRVHALNAYRALTAKKAKVGLSPAEEQQLLDVEQALGQKLAFDMDGVKGEAPAVVKDSLTTQPPLQIKPLEGITKEKIQSELKAGERTGNFSLVTDAKVRLAILTGDPEIIHKAILDEMGIRAPIKRDGNDLMMEVTTNQSMAALMRSLRGSFPVLAAMAPDGRQAIKIIGVPQQPEVTQPPPKAIRGSITGQQDMMLGGETLKGGQMTLFASPSQNPEFVRIRKVLGETLTKKPTEHVYENTVETRPEIQKFLEAYQLDAVTPTDMELDTADIERVSGAQIVFCRPRAGNSFESTNSLTIPRIIAINANSESASVGYMIAHEMAHVAQKASNAPTGPILAKMQELISQDELKALRQFLISKGYDPIPQLITAEIHAHLVGDAVTNSNTLALPMLLRSSEVKSALVEYFDSLPYLEPDAQPGQYFSEPGMLFSSPSGEKRVDPLLAAIKKLITEPEKKAETFARMNNLVNGVRKRFDNARLKKEFSKQGVDAARYTQIRDVAILEAVAKSLPPEIRGKLIGSFRRLDELKTERGREQYLLKMLPKIEAALENHLQKLYRKEIRKVIDKSKPRPNESRNLRGRIGAVGHAIAKQATDAMTMTNKEALALAAEKRDIIEAGTREVNGEEIPLTFDEWEELEGQAMALELFADYENADSARLEKALEFLKDVYAESREQWLEILKERKAKKESDIDALREAIQAPEFVSNEMLAAAKKKSDKITHKFADSMLEWISSYEQILGRLKENTTDPKAIAWVDEQTAKLRDARGQYDDRLEAERQALESAMEDIFATRNGWIGKFQLDPILHELSTRRDDHGITVLEGVKNEPIVVPKHIAESLIRREVSAYDHNGKRYEITSQDMPALTEAWERFEELPDEVQAKKRVITFTRQISAGRRNKLGPYSQLELLKEWLAMRQTDLAKKYASRGWDETTMEELEHALKPEVKRLGLWMVDRLESQRAELDAKHREEYGIGMDMVDNYFPALFEAAQNQESTLSTDGTDTNVRAKTASGLKSRVAHNARPRQMNALSVFLSNRAQIHYFMTHTTPLREMLGTFRSTKSNERMRVVFGDNYVRNLGRELKLIETNGMLQADGVLEAEKFMRKVQSGYALGILGLKLSTLAINTTAVLNTALGVPASKLVKGFTPEYIGDVRRFFDTPAIRRRLKHGTSHEVRVAAQGGIGSHPIAAGSRRLAQTSLEAINWWDTFSNGILGAAAYRAALEEARAAGLSEEQATRRAEQEIDRLSATVMQPNNLLSRSIGEAQFSQHPIGGLMFMFATEPRKNIAIGLYAMRKLLTGKGPMSAGMAAQQVITLALFYSALGYMIRSAYQAAFNAGDDEPEELMKRLHTRMTDAKGWTNSLMTEHLKGIPLIGEAMGRFITGAINETEFIQGKPIQQFDASPNPLNRAVRSAFDAAALTDDKLSPEQKAEQVISAIQGSIGMLPETAVLSQAGNVAKDALGLLTSNGMELSQEEKIRRMKKRFNKFKSQLPSAKTEDGRQDPEIKMQRDQRQVEYLQGVMNSLMPDDRKAFLKALNDKKLINDDVKAWISE